MLPPALPWRLPPPAPPGTEAVPDDDAVADPAVAGAFSVAFPLEGALKLEALAPAGGSSSCVIPEWSPLPPAVPPPPPPPPLPPPLPPVPAVLPLAATLPDPPLPPSPLPP